MKIRFNSVEEWRAELDRDGPAHGYVRVTRMYVPLPWPTFLYRVGVIAAYTNRVGHVIELCQECGEATSNADSVSVATAKRAEELMDLIALLLRERNLEERGGYFTDEDLPADKT